MRRTLARIARIATFAGVTLVLGLVLTGWALRRSGTVDGWIRSALAQRLGSDVQITAARVIWWPPAIELDGVSLAAAPAAGAAVVRCQFALMALLTGRLVPVALQIDGLRLAIERAADGTWTAGGLERVVAASAAGANGAAGAQPLPVLHVRSAAIALRDGSAERPPVQLEQLRADLRPQGPGATVGLAGQLAGGGSLRVHGALPSLQPLSFAGEVHLDRLPADTLAAWLPAAAGHTATGHLRVTATLRATYGEAVDARGSLELFDGEIAAADWRIRAPVRISGQALWDGAALRVDNAALDVALVGTSAASVDMVAATGAYRDRVLHIDSATLRACGGTWRIAGNASSDPPARVDATVAANDIDGRHLAATLTALGVSAAFPDTEAPLRLDAAGAGVVGGAWSGHVTLASDGGLRWPSARADGPLQVAADVAVDGGSLALTGGQGRARRIAFAGQAVEAVDAAFAYRSGALQVAPLRGGAFGGTWTYRGTLPLDAAAPWRGQLDAAHVSAAAVPGLNDLDGPLDLRAQLDGRGAARIAGSATLRLASDTLTWRNARISAPADVSVAGRLEGDRLTISNGRASAAHVSLGEVAAADVRAAFGYANETLAIASAHARSGAGLWKAAATIPLADPSQSSGSIEAQDVALDALLGAAGGAAVGAHTQGAVADLSVHFTPATNARLHGSAAVQLHSGTLVWNDLRVDAPAAAHGAFTIRNGALTLSEASGTAARAAYGPLVGTQATAAFRYGADRLTFTDLRFHSCEGAWTARGWFTLKDDGPFWCQLTIADASPGRLAAMLGDESFDIPFARAGLEATVTGAATSNWLSTLRGTGSASLIDGTTRSATVLGPILESFVGPGRITDAFKRSKSHIARISETFELRGDQLDTDDFLLTGEDYGATAIGTIGLDGSMDITARIRLTARGIEKMLVLGSIPLPTAALPGLPSIPAFVTGTVARPVVHPDVAALPAATGRWLVEAALHVPRTAGSAILDGLQQLWRGTARAVGLATEHPP